MPVDCARRKKHVQPVTRGIAQRRRCELNVLAVAARKTTNDCAVDLACDGIDTLPVAARGGRKSRLDDVDAEVGKGARHAQLLGARHAATW